MNEAELFDPIAGPVAGWPPGSDMLRAYLQAFALRGSTRYIANLRTRVLGARYRERVLPVTVNAGEYGDAYVCLPHSAYALYARAELKLVDAGPWAPVLAALADAAGLAMRAARLNRIVNLANWMVSTNLHGGWAGEGLAELRQALMAAFPDHVLAVRSVNAWSDPMLAQALRADGWRRLPSRRVYVTDDLGRDWASRRDTRRDRRAFARTSLALDELESLRPGDAERIANLYALLYLERYSALNPAFTAAFVELTHETGLIRYRGLRGEDGRLVAVIGALRRSGVLTTPIVGYDTAAPPKAALYRMASVLFAELALHEGLRLNGSAGAAGFKRHRGARAVTEHTAVFVEHLSPPRRAGVRALQLALDRVALPLMIERGL